MSVRDPKNPLEIKRHSLSHITAAALLQLYPGTKLGVGPAIDDGYYHDFELPDGQQLSEESLEKIEKLAKEMIEQNQVFTKEMKPIDEAIAWLSDRGQKYTKELAQDLKKSGHTEVSFYTNGNFTNMCSGPHVSSTKEIDPASFKLTRLSGAYWKGDEKNPQIQRVYGVAFNTKLEIDEYFVRQAEAKKRDHRLLGKELNLFTFSDLVGKGLPLWTHYGAAVRRELENFIVQEELKRGYLHVITPELAKVDLYKTSGHYPYYKADMYPPMKIDDDRLILRPMTCPHHFMLYADKKRSYRELPMRFAELARLYRYEQSGELTGMLRVRSFCLADAHIVCRKAQAKDEIKNVIDLIEFVASTFGLQKKKDYSYRLSLGDRTNKKKYYKNDKAWDDAEQVLRETLQELKAPYIEAKNEAAFYGPKIDVQMKNVSGKEDTAFTVQYDFCMPDRFKLSYVNEKGDDERPVVIHRSSIGAIERVFGFLIEHYAGAFPLWLSPIHIALIPVSEKHIEFATDLFKEFVQHNFRVENFFTNETVGKKISEASKKKIPYILVLGDKEISNGFFQVRKRGQKETVSFSKKKFVDHVKNMIEKKSLDL